MHVRNRKKNSSNGDPMEKTFQDIKSRTHLWLAVPQCKSMHVRNRKKKSSDGDPMERTFSGYS